MRNAFAARGHDAISVDLQPTRRPGRHHVGDALEFTRAEIAAGRRPDIVIAHPTCRYLANSGVCHLYVDKKKVNGPNPERWALMRDAAEFFRALLDLDVPRLCVENPVMHCWARDIIGVGPTQTVQPWMFGHPETKATSFWLRGLPKLVETHNVKAEMLARPKREAQRIHYMSPGPDRERERSVTFQGIADAMASQWG